ncbi:MAG TPA: sigma-70 family RNA polymerase sigma factor [Solirubrobacteraceae bacterium]|jgi:RNA polymerase sigma factor (sigma-70 family)|nr:sigma-70 family RNA polymerase sigma factor [Solirubrobacteraceae bacterium]
MAATLTAVPRNREHQLVRAAKLGGPREREQLVEQFTPLIASVARRYQGARGIERRELMQEGVAGLLRALDRYDPDRGTPFWPYAKSWVLQAMQRLVAQLSHPIVLSDRALREFARIKAARERCAQRDRHDPTSEELALEAGIPGDHVRGLLAAQLLTCGLDECPPGSEEQGRTIAEVVTDPAAEQEYDAVVLRLVAERLPDLLGELDEHEGSVVAARYGLEGEPRTLREVGAELSLTAERVRQIQRTALDKLSVGAGSA